MREYIGFAIRGRSAVRRQAVTGTIRLNRVDQLKIIIWCALCSVTQSTATVRSAPHRVRLRNFSTNWPGNNMKR